MQLPRVSKPAGSQRSSIHVFAERSCKMAARWGTGEEILNACNMEYFSTSSLDEQSEILQDSLYALQHHGLDDALEATLDSSILSIFDSPDGGVKHVEESEATLLMALTETLDNVDDENFSPFDTLPDMEVFQGQKTHEQFLRSDDGDATFSKHIQDLGTGSLDELDWCLPVSLEKDGENMSVTLGDLVKHMQPYSMTLCLEGHEQLLPRGGIVLEVVDEGEHGEPILAIPDLGFPFPLFSGDLAEGEQAGKGLDKAQLKPDDIPAEGSVSSNISEVEAGKMEDERVKKHEPSFEKCPLNRKKKRKAKEARYVDGNVLKSASSKKAVQEPVKAPQEDQKKKKRVTFAPVLTEVSSETSKVEDVKKTESHAAKESPAPTLTTPPTTLAQAGRQDDPLIQDEVIESTNLDVMKPIQAAVPLETCKENDAASKQGWAEVQASECKPKSLSLQQYRLLRQQKKLCSLEKNKDSSNKWPMLPEVPKELPLIPCLPAPIIPRDPRRPAPTPVKKDPAPEIIPAWQPKGPAVPPTPEALLSPPPSILASSRKPTSVKSVPPSPSIPAQNSATLTSPSTLSNPQTLPVATCVSHNTITNKVSQTTKQSPAEITVPLTVASATGVPPSPHSVGQEKCLQDTPSAVDQVSIASPSEAPSRVQDVPRPHAETEVTTRDATNILISDAATDRPHDASSLKKGASHGVEGTVNEPTKPTLLVKGVRPAADHQRRVAPIAAQPFITSAPMQARIVKLAEEMRVASAPVPKSQNPAAKLVESFTTEIGIEAADLTSLLEQFEETQPKEDHTVPEVCGRAAAVGNSSTEEQAETKALKKVCSPDLGSTAGLTPPATPPHQMWKPLAPVALLVKPKKPEVPKLTPAKAIAIEPLPLRPNKLQNRAPPTSSVTLGPTKPFSLDHDYCLLPKDPHQTELGNCSNVKPQQPGIVIKSPQQSTAKLPPTTARNLEKHPKPSHPPVRGRQCEQKPLMRSITLTPDASPDRLDCKGSLQDEGSSTRQRFQRYSERSPSPFCHKRGNSQRTYRKRVCSSSGSRSSSSGSSRSSSSGSSRSRSRSPSPPRKRRRSGHSGSGSRSPSRYRSCSQSPSPPRQRRSSYSSSGSWSRSRSRSRSPSHSPAHRLQQWNSHCSSYYHYDSRDHNEETRRRKEKAIEERRVVYVGRIHGSMTRKELKERFSFFGEIEECTVHFREHGDNYGFVTYYNTKNAFDAIESGSKLRQPNELPFDLCFGGRRQFCRTSYADLDSNRDFEPVPAKGKFDALDFDTLLKQAQRSLKR